MADRTRNAPYLLHSLVFLLSIRLPSAVSARTHTEIPNGNSQLTNSSPQLYPGAPTGSLSPDWQAYYEVDSASLPNTSSSVLPRNWAGNIAVNRPEHPNNTLFFWAFENASKNGSLTEDGNGDPWIIWLNGGPGTSSMLGVLQEHGPMRLQNDGSLQQNAYSWHQLADIIYIDQPVGTGWSTSDSLGYVANEDDVANDFLGFLANLVLVFPNLATRPLYLSGESYAGTYIPYITRALFSTANPPVALKKISMGDPKLGSIAASIQYPVLSVIETYPQLIGYDQEVYDYFATQHDLCGYNVSLEYPASAVFGPMDITEPTDPLSPFGSVPNFAASLPGRKQHLAERAAKASASTPQTSSHDDIAARHNARARSLAKREAGRRSVAFLPNNTISPYYGCLLWEELWDYAFNFSYPWTAGGPVNVYDIPDALFPEVPTDAGNKLTNTGNFLNDEKVRAALHAPTDKPWIEEFTYPWGNVPDGGDPSPEPATFLSELASNASSRGVSFAFFSGNDDSLTPHLGTELTIQNMTFGGVQGFTKAPSTSWYTDDGTFAGLVHQERSVTYALFDQAGHMIAYWQPAAAFTFARDFILGTNSTGTLASPTGVVEGGTNTATGLATGFIPGQPGIFFGSGSTAGTVTYSSATVAAWASQIGPVASTTAPASSATGSKKSGSSRAGIEAGVVLSAVMVVVGMFATLG